MASRPRYCTRVAVTFRSVSMLGSLGRGGSARWAERFNTGTSERVSRILRRILTFLGRSVISDCPIPLRDLAPNASQFTASAPHLTGHDPQSTRVEFVIIAAGTPRPSRLLVLLLDTSSRPFVQVGH